MGTDHCDDKAQVPLSEGCLPSARRLKSCSLLQETFQRLGLLNWLLPAVAMLEGPVAEPLLSPTMACSPPTSLISIAWVLVTHLVPCEMLSYSSVREEHHYLVATHHHYQSPGR